MQYTTLGNTGLVVSRLSFGALKGRRAEVVITTKVGFRTGPALIQTGLSLQHILWSIDESLKRLATALSPLV